MTADVQQLSQDAAKLAEAELWSLSDDDLVSVLRTTHRLEQTIKVLQARSVREADGRGLPGRQGFRTVPAWVRAVLRVDPQPAREMAANAALLARQPVVERAVLDGQVDLRQAAVIGAAVEAVPDTLADIDASATGPSSDGDPATGEDQSAGREPISLAETREIGERARAAMIEMAGQFPAYQLRRIGDRILAYVAPELSDRAEEVFLERQQARAHKRRGFTLGLPVDGLVRVSGLLDTEAAAIVQAALHPLCRPIPGDDRPMAQRRADALVEICNSALRAADLPEDGGEPPQITVTVPYDVLANAMNSKGSGADRPRADRGADTETSAHPDAEPEEDSRAEPDGAGAGTETDGDAAGDESLRRDALGVGITDTGQRLAASVVRRLACEARLLPAVLGGAGQILDLGRSRRLVTGALRRALHLRDRGCAHPGCDRPPRWTDCHHIRSWSDGGVTNLDNTVLLCRFHHRLIHHPTAGWEIRLGADRRPYFIPPPHIDPEQKPIRNVFHLCE